MPEFLHLVGQQKSVKYVEASPVNQVRAVRSGGGAGAVLNFTNIYQWLDAPLTSRQSAFFYNPGVREAKREPEER